MANESVDLTGLKKHPATENKPTEADIRWLHRDEAKRTAEGSYKRWPIIVTDDLTNPARQLLAEQIAETSLIGFYSIWCKVFQNEKTVLDEINKIRKEKYHNFKSFHPDTGERIIRTNGQI